MLFARQRPNSDRRRPNELFRFNIRAVQTGMWPKPKKVVEVGSPLAVSLLLIRCLTWLSTNKQMKGSASYACGHKLRRTGTERFSAYPPEGHLPGVGDVTPADVATVCVPARSVLVSPELPDAGAEPASRKKLCCTAVRAALGPSRLRFHWQLTL